MQACRHAYDIARLRRYDGMLACRHVRRYAGTWTWRSVKVRCAHDVWLIRRLRMRTTKNPESIDVWTCLHRGEVHPMETITRFSQTRQTKESWHAHTVGELGSIRCAFAAAADREGSSATDHPQSFACSQGIQRAALDMCSNKFANGRVGWKKRSNK